MRTIKFRAWDSIQKKMSYSVNVYSEETGNWWSADHINPETDDTICSFDDNSGELMQYTGLKDKNGKEIYEGDILKDHGEVAWNDVDLCWSRIDLNWNDDREWHNLDSLTSPMEIIGNIYERRD